MGLLSVCSDNHVCAGAQYVLDDNVTNVSGQGSNSLVDLNHALEHLFLGNGAIGLNGNHGAVLCANRGSDGAHRVGALVNGVLNATGAGIAGNYLL